MWLGTIAAVALATLTPLCSCGTTAILLGGLASSAPWAPLVAFMVASPLTSPAELLLSAGLFGWPFALTFFVGTIGIGLASGGVTARIERTGWLHGQARVTPAPAACGDDACDASASVVPRPDTGAGGGTLTVTRPAPPSVTACQRLRLDDLLRETFEVGRRLVVFFLAFTALGYLLIEAIPPRGSPPTSAPTASRRRPSQAWPVSRRTSTPRPHCRWSPR